MKPSTSGDAGWLVALLASVGITFVGMVTGFLGCCLAQIFLPAQKRDWRRAAVVTLGSMIFASLFSPIVLELVTRWHPLDTQDKLDAWRIYAGAGFGFFAQPLILWASSMLPAVLQRVTAMLPDGTKGTHE